MLYLMNEDGSSAEQARKFALQIWAEITGSPVPTGTPEEVALKFEALNTTD
jgi:hypothetical protein